MAGRISQFPVKFLAFPQGVLRSVKNFLNGQGFVAGAARTNRMTTENQSNFQSEDFSKINEHSVETESEKIILAKEFLNVEKQEITETRSFEKYVEERKVDIPVELLSQEVSVERVPKNEVVAEMPAVRELDGKTIIPVVREEVVVTKRLVLVEEIILTKSESKYTETVSEILREEKFRENK